MRRDREERRHRHKKIRGMRGPREHSSFKYRRRDPEAARARASQKGGAFETAFDNTYKNFSPENGENLIRICPPTWKKPDNYGYEVWVHYSLGDAGTFVCPRMMHGKKCPACEEHDRAQRRGEDEEYVRSLKATKRVAVLVINREKEKDGPQLWLMPWTVDRDINVLSEDKRTKEILPIDDPEEGYDISFKKEGKAKTTKYIGMAIERRPSPLSDDEERMSEWLEFINDHPIPSCLNKHTTEDVAKALKGMAGAKDKDDDEEDEEPRGRHGRYDDEDEDRPRRRKRRDEDDEDEIDDEDESLDEYDDDEEDDRPRKKKTKKKKLKRRKFDDDGDV